MNHQEKVNRCHYSMVSRKERLSYWLRIIFSLIACLIAGCASLPELENRAVSTGLSLDESRATRLGQAVSRGMEEHPGKNGFIPLSNAMDAFAARMLLAGVAEKTLDAQYYIWHGDLTGTLLFEALHKSADRGVRVRLLLDDNNTPGLDMVLAALNAHPNIEVRLFNPFVSRKLRLKDYFFDFSRCNRRMHNKSFTVDNQVTIVGGRNIGDEYFGAAEGMLFADLDILAVGPVVDEVTADFDRYWASESSYPGELILKSIPSSTLDQLAETARSAEQSVAAQAYIDALRDTPFIANLLIGNLAMEWTEIRMVSDDPAKGLGRAEPEAMLPEQLREIIGVPTMDMELVSPYFVPTAAGVSAFSALARQGVNIRVLTNSLEATDVAPVHAGYAKWRKDLLAAGVTLYELRRIAPNTRQRKGVGLFVTSGSSLHAKTFSVDKTLVFVGSFNFDPRSTNLNTELGFVIESPALAAKIKGTFDALVPFSAYEVRLAEDGRLYWLEQDKDGTIRHDSEPGVGFWKRTGVRFISLLPIEWLL